MAGEYDDYKRNEEEIRRDEAHRYGMWYRPKVPLWKKILKAAYWLSTPVLILAAVIAFSVSFGVWVGLMALCGILLVFVAFPLLFLLKERYRWANIIVLVLVLFLFLYPVFSFIFRLKSSFFQ